MTRSLTGALIIIAGVLILLANLDVPGVRSFLSTWWPLALVIAGLLVFINDRRSYVWAIILAGLGVILQVNRLEIADINPFTFFWPAIIIAAGISIIMGNRRGGRAANASAGSATAIMSGISQQSGHEDYDGGSATALLGGVRLDLRKAKIKDGASLNVFAFWGGIELVVPEDVIVKSRAMTIMGGIEDKGRPADSRKAPTLFIDGTVLMGGLEIKR